MPLDSTNVSPAKAVRASGKQARARAVEQLEIAQKARRDGDRGWDRALAGCVLAGVIPNYATDPQPVGTNEVVYADAKRQLLLGVSAPIVGIDFVGFVAGLAKGGVDAKLIARLSKKCRTETRPAHKLTVVGLG